MSKVPQHKPDDQKSAADVSGPWVEPDSSSGLIDRCRRYWTTPISQLPNQILAMFLRQNIAVQWVAAEARRRIADGIEPDTELYEGELEAALRDLP
jgi:hypothetical protein